MKNINLNAGGFIGAAVLVVAVILVSLAFDLEAGGSGGRVGKLVVSAVIFGALGGNTLWSHLFPDKQ